MPLFSTFLLSLCNGLASLFARFMGIEAAIKLAAYVAWIALLAGLLTTTYICSSALHQMIFGGTGGGGTGWIRYFWMGVGAFIPPNAGAVLSCVASVWLATNIFRVQSFAIKTFHGGGALTTT